MVILGPTTSHIYSVQVSLLDPACWCSLYFRILKRTSTLLGFPIREANRESSIRRLWSGFSFCMIFTNSQSMTSSAMSWKELARLQVEGMFVHSYTVQCTFWNLISLTFLQEYVEEPTEVQSSFQKVVKFTRNSFSCHLPIQAVPGKGVGRAPPPIVIVQDIEIKSNLLLFTR